MIDPTTGVSTTTSKADSALQTLSGDYENFLKLLTTQLQNQDPTNPADTTQLTQQIAMLSQVEQQINANKNLEKLIDLTNSTQYNSIVSYIGKQIEAPGAAGSLDNGSALYVYYLENEASTVSISITDEAGNTVYSGAGTTTRGRNQFEWDGIANNGTAMPDGVYNITIEAKDGGGGAISSQTYTTGIVSAVDSAGGQVYLSFGSLSIPVGNVTSVRAVETDEAV